MHNISVSLESWHGHGNGIPSLSMIQLPIEINDIRIDPLKNEVIFNYKRGGEVPPTKTQLLKAIELFCQKN